LLITLAGGCGTIVHDVRFSPTPSFEPPIAGTGVVVEVLDGSSEENGILLGRVNPGLEHRFVLVGEESFAARLGRDLVSALRARGYRAYRQSDTSPGAPEDIIILTIKSVTRSIDPVIGRTSAAFNGTFVFECAATVGRAPSAAWSETIDYHVQKPYSGSLWSTARAFEGVYWLAVVEIVHRFSTALPPSP